MSKWDPANPGKYLGTAEDWDKVQNAMRAILDDIGLEYTEEDGEAAFYGPKLDIQAKNVYGKEDTMITIQLDMFLAERYDMYYIDANGEKKRPYIIHRTSMGCYERTLAWLIEHYAGKFPTWLSPLQVKILPVSEKTRAYALEVGEKLRAAGVRVKVDDRDEKIGYKIREARSVDRVPYMLILGEKEKEAGNISVRDRATNETTQRDLADFVKDICQEIKERRG